MSRCLFSLFRQSHSQQLHYNRIPQCSVCRQMGLRHYNKMTKAADVLILKNQNTNRQCIRYHYEEMPKAIVKKEKEDEEFVRRDAYMYDLGITTEKLAFAALASFGILLYFDYLLGEDLKEADEQFEHEYNLSIIKTNFELKDTNGVKRKSEEFLGKWVVILVGFTHYPDSCTEQLKKIAEALDKVESKSADIQTIFITIDPNNDTRESIKGYLQNISPKWIGLTGTVDDIQTFCEKMQLQYNFIEEYKNENDNNTLCMYLVDPKGDLVDFVKQNSDLQEFKNRVSMNTFSWDSLVEKTRKAEETVSG